MLHERWRIITAQLTRVTYLSPTPVVLIQVDGTAAQVPKFPKHLRDKYHNISNIGKQRKSQVQNMGTKNVKRANCIHPTKHYEGNEKE